MKFLNRLVGIIAILIAFVIVFVTAGKETGTSGAEQSALIIDKTGNAISNWTKTLQGRG